MKALTVILVFNTLINCNVEAKGIISEEKFHLENMGDELQRSIVEDSCDFGCGSSGPITCTYEGAYKVTCGCSNSSYVFVSKEEGCKVGCNITTCENGGACHVWNGAVQCTCLKGTGGDRCEKVDGCENLDCGKEAACAYNLERRKPFCLCENSRLRFDPKDKRCKESCEENGCANGGSCEASGDNKFCKCIKGTKGDLCNEVDDCWNRCGMDAVCLFNQDKRQGYCQCHNERLTFDPLSRRCQNICFPNPCLNNGSCATKNGSVKCSCQHPYTGERCERETDITRWRDVIIITVLSVMLVMCSAAVISFICYKCSVSRV